MANDPELGKRVHEMLRAKRLETPMGKLLDGDKPDIQEQVRLQAWEMLESLGLDMNDDSIKGTPNRLAKMYLHELFWGMDYDLFPDCTVVENKMAYKEMVVRDGIDVKSMCEHHFLPIVGRATIAYLPSDKVIGLSKMDRIVEFFSRRPQMQERLTEQIAATLQFILGTDNVAVVIKAEHFCVSHRGVQGSKSDTITSRLLGKFFDIAPLRQEFTALIRK